MIEAGLEFDGENDRVMKAIVDLPAPLRPVHFSHEEKLANYKDRISDLKRFASFLAKSQSGFFLLGPGLTYSVRIATGMPTIYNCFLEVEPQVAERFLMHMSKETPIFGYACVSGEREWRNRVTTQQGVNKIESWVGRDPRRYVPGFYWLTLLSEALARQHGILLDAVKLVAREHIDLGNGQHLFRFYDRPEDWSETSAVADLCASQSGVFDIEKVKPQAMATKNFIELSDLLRQWS